MDLQMSFKRSYTVIIYFSQFHVADIRLSAFAVMISTLATVFDERLTWRWNLRGAHVSWPHLGAIRNLPGMVQPCHHHQYEPIFWFEKQDALYAAEGHIAKLNQLRIFKTYYLFWYIKKVSWQKYEATTCFIKCA